MTAGSPPSTTATTELVVPRSMPITLAMSRVSPPSKCLVPSRRDRRERIAPPPPALSPLRHVDLDLLWLDLLGLGQLDGQHAIAIARFDLVRLHRDGQWKSPFEFPEPPLPSVVALLLDLLAPVALAPHGQHVTGDGEMDVLLVEPGQ